MASVKICRINHILKVLRASPSATGENVHSLPWRYGSSCWVRAAYLPSTILPPFPPHHYSNVPNPLQIPDTTCYSCLLAVRTLPLARNAFRHSGKEGSTCLLWAALSACFIHFLFSLSSLVQFDTVCADIKFQKSCGSPGYVIGIHVLRQEAPPRWIHEYFWLLLR